MLYIYWFFGIPSVEIFLSPPIRKTTWKTTNDCLLALGWLSGKLESSLSQGWKGRRRSQNSSNEELSVCHDTQLFLEFLGGIPFPSWLTVSFYFSTLLTSCYFEYKGYSSEWGPAVEYPHVDKGPMQARGSSLLLPALKCPSSWICWEHRGKAVGRSADAAELRASAAVAIWHSPLLHPLQTYHNWRII